MPSPRPFAIDTSLARAVAGERAAIDGLVARWSGPIRRWALASLGDPVLADDASQEVVTRLLAGLPSFDLARPFEPWLRAVVRHACTDVHRRRQRAKEGPEVDVAHRPDPAWAIDLDRSARAALAALEHLTERQREIVLMVDHEGRSPAEVAAELGVAPGTVRATLHGARRAVRLQLLASNPEIVALLEGT